MKKYLLLALTLLITSSLVRADSIAYPLTANVASNLFVGSKIIDMITITATSTNITTARFYDSSNTSTTVVQVAYENWTSYATNITQVYTNEAGLLVTNNFVGRWTYPSTVSAATNSRPVKLTLVVPGSSVRTKDVNLMTTFGLNVVANQAAIVEVDYRNNP